MVLNVIWVAFFLIAVVVAMGRLLTGDLTVFTDLQDALFNMAKVSVEIAIGLISVMVLWLGIMKVGEDGGAVKVLTRLVSPFFQRLFPEIPKDHPASGAMMMNFSANMLGLDNAATPLGLKAMKELQELNPKKDTASNAMIMFLVLNVSGLTVVPISVIAIRAANGAANPTDIFIPILIATFFATLAGLIAVSLLQRINLLEPIVLSYLCGATIFMTALMLYFSNPLFMMGADPSYTVEEILDPKAFPDVILPDALAEKVKTDLVGKSDEEAKQLIAQMSGVIFSEENGRAARERMDLQLGNAAAPLKLKLIRTQSSLLASFIIFGIITTFSVMALFRRVNVYESFIEGAKEGFGVAIKIIPYLVAMLVAVGVFRASGALTELIDGIRWIVGAIGLPTAWVDAMPTAFMKPLSGSGARAMAVEAMQTHGADSFAGRLACCFQGSTETVFYVLAVYFGSVGIRKTRYTLTCGLIADVVGVTVAILTAYIFFGR